jgi:hypothetical protein
VDVESKSGEEGDLEQVDMVLVARVSHLVWWQLRKLPLRLPLPNLATVDSFLKILCDS